jgi:arsenate reductase
MTWQIDNRLRVLFVCIGNMCRSPMAEGFARAWGDGVVEAYSAGTSPSGLVSEESIQAMLELGFDISHQTSKGLDDVPLEDIDLVVNLTGRPATMFLPNLLRGRVIDWRVEDPVGRPLPMYRKARDEIAALVKGLLTDVRDGRLPGRR